MTGPKVATAASIGILLAGSLAAGGSVARGLAEHTVSHPLAVATKAPPGTAKGSFLALDAVPHSTDVWAIGSIEGKGVDGQAFEARRHHGHWHRYSAPKVGNFGEINTIAAGSVRSIWIAGAKQQPHTTSTLPAIWRLSGKHFVAAKLPKLRRGGSAVSSIAASSASNAWAVGPISRAGTDTPVALHWNGTKWSAVPTPLVLTAVSTSGPRNAWGLDVDGFTFVHWDGHTWSEAGQASPDQRFTDIATSSPTLAYAVGSRLGPHGVPRTVIRRFNGTGWSAAPLATGAGGFALFAVTMHGTSAWALGNRQTRRGLEFPGILHTSGGAWRSQKAVGGSAFTLNDVSAESATHVYAVGFVQAGGTFGETFFDVYNGHSWKGAPSKF